MKNRYRARPITEGVIRELAKSDPPEKAREVLDTDHHLILRHQPSGKLLLYVPTGRGRRERPFGNTCDARLILKRSDPLTLGQVRAESKRIRAEIVTGADFTADRKAARAVPTLKDFIRGDYEPWALKTENLKDGEGTIKRLTACFEKPFGKLKLTEIDKRRVKKWRQGRDVNPRTVNRDVSTLSALMQYAVDEEVIPEHPFKGLPRLKANDDDKIVRALERDEERRLREALKARNDEKRAARVRGNEWRRNRGYEELPTVSTYADHLMPAAIISLETGLRRNELLSLDWRFVDFKKKEIMVHWVTSKTDRSRVVPLNRCAFEMMRAWWLQRGQPKEGIVFPGAKGKLGSLKTAYYAVLDAANIPRVDAKGMRVNWHSLRHSFGTRLGAEKVDPVTIQKLMGHQDLQTTSRYLHSEPERMRYAVEKLAL